MQFSEARQEMYKAGREGTLKPVGGSFGLLSEYQVLNEGSDEMRDSESAYK